MTSKGVRPAISVSVTPHSLGVLWPSMSGQSSVESSRIEYATLSLKCRIYQFPPPPPPCKRIPLNIYSHLRSSRYILESMILDSRWDIGHYVLIERNCIHLEENPSYDLNMTWIGSCDKSTNLELGWIIGILNCFWISVLNCDFHLRISSHWLKLKKWWIQDEVSFTPPPPYFFFIQNNIPMRKENHGSVC